MTSDELMAVLIVAVLAVFFCFIAVLRHLETKASIAAGLQECYIDGHMLWQRECGK